MTGGLTNYAPSKQEVARGAAVPHNAGARLAGSVVPSRSKPSNEPQPGDILTTPFELWDPRWLPCDGADGRPLRPPFMAEVYCGQRRDGGWLISSYVWVPD